MNAGGRETAKEPAVNLVVSDACGIRSLVCGLNIACDYGRSQCEPRYTLQLVGVEEAGLQNVELCQPRCALIDVCDVRGFKSAFGVEQWNVERSVKVQYFAVAVGDLYDGAVAALRCTSFAGERKRVQTEKAEIAVKGDGINA